MRLANHLFQLLRDKELNKLFVLRRLFISSSLILFFGSLNLNAQTPLSLSKAIKIGLSNNLDIQISNLETQTATNQLNAIKKDRLPRLSANISQNNSIVNDRSPTTLINNFYRDHFWSFGVNGDWVIFDGFKGRIGAKRFQKIKKEFEGRTQLAIENTIYAITLAYYKALLEKEALLVAQKAKQLSEERYKNGTQQERLGKISNYDLLRLKNALLSDSTTILIQQKKYEAALEILRATMGQTKAIVYQLTDKLAYDFKDYNFKKLLPKLKQGNQALENQYSRLEAQRETTQLLKADLYPTIAVNSGIFQRMNNTYISELGNIKSNTFNFYVSFSVNYNLFDGGRTKRAIQESQIQEKVELLKKDQIEQSLSNDLVKFVKNYQRQLAIIELNDELIQNIEKSLRLEKDRFDNGISVRWDYRTLQQEFVTAQYRKLEAIFELLSNELEILRLTGDLGER